MSRQDDPGADRLPSVTRPGAAASVGREPSCGPECQAALERLEAFLDGELPETEIGRVAEHLSACYPCTDRATFERELRAVVRRSCHDRAPEDLAERVRARLGIDLDVVEG